MQPPAMVARALADQAELVAVALLGQPTSTSRRDHRWGRHGSFSLRTIGKGRGRWSDYQSGERGDLLDLIARVRGVRPGDAIRIAEREFLGGAVAKVHTAQERRLPQLHVPRVDDASARAGAALRIWREAVPLGGTLGERYFVDHRRLDIKSLDLAHVLRWHHHIRAVVALMTDAITAEPIGIHRTFLDTDGTKRDRKMLGRQGVIRLSPDDAVTAAVGVTEGIEDGLAVLLSGWAPIWVATSAGAIARFPVLAGIEALTVFADADAPGTQAAEGCAARWRDYGRDARVASPGGVRP